MQEQHSQQRCKLHTFVVAAAVAAVVVVVAAAAAVVVAASVAFVVFVASVEVAGVVVEDGEKEPC